MTTPPADSAGVPWVGRALQPPPFAGDDGAAHPTLAAVLDHRAQGRGDLRGVVAAVAGSRLLVPVVAAGGEPGAAPSAQMALPRLRGRDGRVALPVFSSAATLAGWDAAARPVPVDARRAALSAVEDGADVLVLDVAGPVPVTLPRPAVWALAQGRRWTPSPEDPEVHAAVAATLSADPRVREVACGPGRRAELAVTLIVVPGLDRSGLDALTAAASRRLAADVTVADRVDSVEMRIRAG